MPSSNLASLPRRGRKARPLRSNPPGAPLTLEQMLSRLTQTPRLTRHQVIILRAAVRHAGSSSAGGAFGAGEAHLRPHGDQVGDVVRLRGVELHDEDVARGDPRTTSGTPVSWPAPSSRTQALVLDGGLAIARPSAAGRA